MFEQNFGHVMIPERPNVPPNLEDLMSASKWIFLKHSILSTIRGKVVQNYGSNVFPSVTKKYQQKETTKDFLFRAYP